MKYCEEFAALLDPYADGELSGEEAARVRAHLERCPGCRSYVDGALAIRAAFPKAERLSRSDAPAEELAFLTGEVLTRSALEDRLSGHSPAAAFRVLD